MSIDTVCKQTREPTAGRDHRIHYLAAHARPANTQRSSPDNPVSLALPAASSQQPAPSTQQLAASRGKPHAARVPIHQRCPLLPPRATTHHPGSASWPAPPRPAPAAARPSASAARHRSTGCCRAGSAGRAPRRQAPAPAPACPPAPWQQIVVVRDRPADARANSLHAASRGGWPCSQPPPTVIMIAAVSPQTLKTWSGPVWLKKCSR
jgi:hypothetical protein